MVGHREHIRILLSPKSAARIEFLPSEKGGLTWTVLLPTDPEEVRRLAVAVEALIHFTPFRLHYSVMTVSDDTVSISYRRDGVTRSVQGPACEWWQNYVWQGIQKEIEAISLLELARAVVFREEAEQAAERGNLDAAIMGYNAAIFAFRKWASDRISRYGRIMIWEPEVAMSFEYPDAMDSGKSWVIKGWPDDVMKLPGIDAKWALRFLRYAWTAHTKEPQVLLSRSQRIIVVRFMPLQWKEANQRWMWWLPVDGVSETPHSTGGSSDRPGPARPSTGPGT